ncbi:hypothetical protein FHR81_005367 [Actinoalloteichus hoggarensis]|uniref:Uncharacterized protein n=1 Tax=Actinoalloteichus hoggarensis TaxID=1470176 RepID=A0A221VWJ9_9PSEU|nr:glycosyltransferase family 39 protein [Actinoalloteichus hoggarensis]ASO17878.1 hypothetical protein AHOG_01055 [Actinoalloteichus hoggarensis]MBB5924290.1 hypothetical protein [Actinoalloteichus hoggarensis]
MSATSTAEDARSDPSHGRGSEQARPSIAARLADWAATHPRTARLAVLAAPAVVYLALRQLGLIVLGWAADRHGVSPIDARTSWDGQWYLSIATRGYSDVSPDLYDAFGRRTEDTSTAFFPGYPALVRLLDAVPGGEAVPAALLVSLLSGVACAYALMRLAASVSDSRRVGLILVALFTCTPLSIALSMAYSEALFCALAAWALVGVVERRWLLAGLCCAATGLVRPTAAALILAVGLAALVAVLHRRDGWRPWVAGLLAPLGMLGYLGWVAVRTGSPTGWFDVQQAGWDSRFDGGAATLRFTTEVLASGQSVLEVGTVALLIAGVVSTVVAVRMRLPWPLVVYGAGVLVMDLGSNGLMNSKARLLLPAFTLLIPVALGLGRRRPGTAVAVVAAAALAGSWFGAYALVAWPYAI